jgi:competence protein ComEC
MVKFLGSLSVGFLVGVLTHSIFFSVPILNMNILIIIGLGLFTSLIFSNTKVILVGVFIIGAGLGVLRFSSQINIEESTLFDVFVIEHESLTIHGIISSEPIKHVSYTQFVLSTDQLITHAEKTLSAKTQILIKTDNYTDYEYGQEVVVQSVLEKPTSFITDSQRTFDYEAYLAKDTIYYIMSYADAVIFEEGEKSLQRSLYSLKHNFLDQIYRFIPEPESGLLAGILFGQKSGLDDELEDKFRIVGLMHIVVLSGYNVSLVIQIFTKLLAFLPRKLRAILAVLAIAGFALLVGAGPTVIRASIMAVFIVLADVLGARYNIARALFIAGLMMVIWNPMILYFDISFQLSFLATYGLITVSPIVGRWFKKLPTVFAIRESAVATVSAQIMVLPLIIYTIGEFSLISPLVNVLVLFSVPVAMLSGFVTAVLGMTLSWMAPFAGFITTYLLKYQLWIVDVFANLSFSNINIPPFHWSLMVVLYVGIFWWIKNTYSSEDQKM